MQIKIMQQIMAQNQLDLQRAREAEKLAVQLKLNEEALQSKDDLEQYTQRDNPPNGLMSSGGTGKKRFNSTLSERFKSPVAGRKKSFMLSRSSTKKMNFHAQLKNDNVSHFNRKSVLGNSITMGQNMQLRSPKYSGRAPTECQLEFQFACGFCKTYGHTSIYDKKCLNCKKDNPYYEPYPKALTELQWRCKNQECDETINQLPNTECRNCFLPDEEAKQLC